MAKPGKKSKQAEAVDAPAPEAAATAAPASGSPIPTVLGAGIALLGVVVFALPTVIVIAAGMTPSLVAALIPSDGRRLSVAPVAIMNLAGIASVLGTLWRSDHSIAGAIATLSSPISWLIILAAAGLGHAVRSIFPNIATSVMERSAENRVRVLKTEQREIVAEWGAEVRSPARAEAKKGGAAPRDEAAAPRRAGSKTGTVV